MKSQILRNLIVILLLIPLLASCADKLPEEAKNALFSEVHLASATELSRDDIKLDAQKAPYPENHNPFFRFNEAWCIVANHKLGSRHTEPSNAWIVRRLGLEWSVAAGNDKDDFLRIGCTNWKAKWE